VKGKLIVIAGIDGSGKATQADLLVKRLKEEDYDVVTTDFPQYGKYSATFIEKYLNGEFGTANEVGPYRASIFYAIDRYAASKQMYKWLEEGKIIVSNRYVSANKGHQASKIKDKDKRERFLEWLDNLEYNIFKIPKPDINILLNIPPEIGQQLVDKKRSREYIGGKKRDIHEADIGHLKGAAEVYLELVEKYDNWVRIDCVREGRLLSKEEIAKKVWEKVETLVKK
jgi:dTMP kinase